MKLNRILFYILLALFVAAVCIVAFTDAGAVWSRVFEFLDGLLSKDEENIVTGSADDFEQTLRKSCVDYHDLIVYERVELSKLITALCNKAFCRTNSKSTAAILLSAADCPMITFGGDKVRDVRKERLEEIRNMYDFEENE